MKIALIGASGNVGSRILTELVQRGHSVTAIVRHPENIVAGQNVRAIKGDAGDGKKLATLLAGHDAVISALRFVTTDAEKLIGIVRASGVKRYLVVGGAGSLEVAPGTRLYDTPDFPEAYMPEARAGGVFLDLLQQERDLDWTFLSPSAVFVPGERTGRFRIGGDQLLTNDKGSSISMEDYAIAMANEIEKPRHIRKRFTVGY